MKILQRRKRCNPNKFHEVYKITGDKMTLKQVGDKKDRRK